MQHKINCTLRDYKHLKPSPVEDTVYITVKIVTSPAFSKSGSAYIPQSF